MVSCPGLVPEYVIQPFAPNEDSYAHIDRQKIEQNDMGILPSTPPLAACSKGECAEVIPRSLRLMASQCLAIPPC